MNKPLLIIICDFLIISILSLYTQSVGMGELEAEQSVQTAKEQESQNAEDMLQALKLAFEEEQKVRKEEQMVRSDLAQELANLEQQHASTLDTLKERETVLETTQQTLVTTEQRAQEIERQRQESEKNFQITKKNEDQLKEHFQAAKAEADKLKSELHSSSKDAAVSNAKLEATERERNIWRREADAMQQKNETLEQKLQFSESENVRLEINLKRSETEAILLKEHVALARNEAELERANRAWAQNEIIHLRGEVTEARTETIAAHREHADKLASTVGDLAETSKQIQDEIRSSRPLTANSIFDDFQKNRVDTRFTSVKSGMFGNRVTKKSDTRSIVATDGQRFFILYHINDTPLSLGSPDTRWEQIDGLVSRTTITYDITYLSVLSLDPRILAVDVGRHAAESLGCKIYPFATDPFQFQEAVLVGSKDSYFGEVEFEMDPEFPSFVKMNRPTFGKLFGKFAPSRGDLVFSKTGELLGIMANKKYCAIFKDIQPVRRIKFGVESSEAETSRALGLMQNRLINLPDQLQ